MPDDPSTANQNPLRVPGFRAFWLASFASNVGSWMHNVAAAWLMTSLTPSPLMAALVKSAGTLHRENQAIRILANHLKFTPDIASSKGRCW